MARDLAPADYTVRDARWPARVSAKFAGERLARVVCADREMLDEAGVSSIADALANAQVVRIAEGVERVLARHPSLRVAVVTGLGAFLGAAAARRLGLKVVDLAAQLGAAAARCAPAASVALLLEQAFRMADGSLLPPAEGPSGQTADQDALSESPRSPSRLQDRGLAVKTVVKLGGGVLANADDFDAVLAAIGAAARLHPLLVVPGGGPFADAVRAVDLRFDLSDDAAHWMAVLAMDQYAQFIASRLADGEIVDGPRAISACAASTPVWSGARAVPLAAEADPLPHSWDVTSDSIAAWVAGQINARRLVVVKPSGAEGNDLVDRYFSRALPTSMTAVIVAADRIDALQAALSD